MFIKTKLIAHIQLLKAEEWKDFGRWLQSPWCNTNKKLIALYTLLKPYYPSFQARQLTKEALFLKLYPERSYNDRWMRNMMAELRQQVEDFLVHQRLERKDATRQRLWQQELLERGRSDWFLKAAKQLTERVQQQEVKSAEDYLRLTLTYEQMYRNIDSAERQKIEGKYFEAADLFLDHFYGLQKARYLIEAKEKEKIVAQNNHSEKEINTFKAFLKKINTPEINFYTPFLEKEISFQKIKNAFFKSIHLINKKDQKIILFLLINTAARLRLKGAKNILPQLLKLFQLGLEHDLILHHNKITASAYANIVTVGNLQKDYTFTASFVAQYTKHLAADFQEDAQHWALTHTAYNQGTPTLLDLEIKLSQRKRHNTSFSLRTQALLLQMRFDDYLKNKKNGNHLIDFSLSFEKQLNREKTFSTERIIALKKLIQYTRKLFKLISNNKLNNTHLNKLLVALNKEKNIHAKKWLEEKIIYTEKHLLK